VAELPVPPAELLFRVVGSREAPQFWVHGALQVAYIADALETLGRPLSGFDRILDFGCGCGRLLAALQAEAPDAALSACDTDSAAIAWVQEAFPAADVRTSDPLPPLPFGDGTFGFVLAFSVFTHLPSDYQDAWLKELARVTRFDGIVAATVHGAAHWRAHWKGRDDSSPLAELHEHGFVYVNDGFWDGSFPDYYGTSWHSPGYVREHWGRWFDVLAHVEGTGAPFGHDVVIATPTGR
jgi:SAM-dependent methyltransferase